MVTVNFYAQKVLQCKIKYTQLWLGEKGCELVQLRSRPLFWEFTIFYPSLLCLEWITIAEMAEIRARKKDLFMFFT